MAGGHNVKATSWVTVALIIVASVLLGFALPTRSISLTIAGGLTLLAGIITGIAFRIMDDAY
jgi:hypothetical protein